MPVNTAQCPTVEIRQTWSDVWANASYLFCNRLTLKTSPELSSAELAWAYGDVMQHDTATFADTTRISIDGWYVRITYATDSLGTTAQWYGIVVQDVDQQFGKRDVGLTDTGMQTLNVVGLEWLLDRSPIYHSWVANGFSSPLQIKRALDFNRGASDNRTRRYAGNREQAYTLPVFAENLDDAAEWNCAQMIDYLLAYAGPTDAAGNANIEFQLSSASKDDLLSTMRYTITQEGRTCKQVIDSIISRQRGMGYYLSVIDNVVIINAFTYTDSSIVLPSGALLKANTDTLDIDLQSDLTVSAPQIVRDYTAKFDQVRMLGEYRTSTFTGEYQAPWDAAWNSTMETAYKNAASGESGYSSAPIQKQMTWNNQVRSRPGVLPVYSYIRFPDNWNGDIASDVPADPLGENHWVPGLRFLPYTPFLDFHDYADDNIVNDTVVDYTPDGAVAGYRPVFGAISTGDGRYTFLSQLGEHGELDDTFATEGVTWAVAIRPLADQCGIELRVQGAPQFVFAKDDFTVTLEADTVGDYQPAYSWKSAKTTVTLQLDSRAEGVYPPSVSPSQEIAAPLSVYIPDMRCDYVVPDTIVDIANDGALITSSGGLIQDDREKLTDLARLAYEWYGGPRMALTIPFVTNTRIAYRLGQFVTSFKFGGTAEASGTVITGIAFDFLSQSSVVTTSYADLDVRAVA